FLDLKPRFNQEDSRRAAELMAADGVRCLVTLGGDDTNRVGAKGCGDLPLMPISTGTNNVFPFMIEATTAGLAAGLVACGQADAAISHAPRIDVYLKTPHPLTSPPPALRLSPTEGEGVSDLPLSPA